jgi:hypothetical protein
MFYVTLKNCGDIELGQDPYKPLPGTEVGIARFGTIDECRNACVDYISDNKLAESNWIGGDVFPNVEMRPDERVGRISFDGKFWSAKGGEIA